jgi:cytochrome P450
MSTVLFDPRDPEFIADPYPTYHRLRTEDPVHLSPLGFWVLTRYEDVVAVLRDPRFVKEPIASYLAERLGASATSGFGISMLDRDPPNHTRLRSLVSKAFTPRVVEGLRPRVQEVVDGLLDGVADRHGMDLIEEFAYPIPVVVICEMLGVPVEDHAQFKSWSLDLARGLDATLFGESAVAVRAAESQRALADYFRRLIATRRTSPRADLLSALIVAEEAGDKLTEIELLATCILLLVAGHETTVNLLGNGVLALLRNPDQLRLLRETPGLIVSAVEELLRYDGPVQRTARMPSAPATIGGHTIQAGEMVMPFIGAADRDPAQFPDPDRLDITRADNRHIAFGWGIHFCLGAPLARIEGQIAIDTLLRRLPKLALAAEGPEHRPSLTLRGLKSLPVAF